MWSSFTLLLARSSHREEEGQKKTNKQNKKNHQRLIQLLTDRGREERMCLGERIYQLWGKPPPKPWTFLQLLSSSACLFCSLHSCGKTFMQLYLNLFPQYQFTTVGTNSDLKHKVTQNCVYLLSIFLLYMIKLSKMQMCSTLNDKCDVKSVRNKIPLDYCFIIIVYRLVAHVLYLKIHFL